MAKNEYVKNTDRNNVIMKMSKNKGCFFSIWNSIFFPISSNYDDYCVCNLFIMGIVWLDQFGVMGVLKKKAIFNKVLKWCLCSWMFVALNIGQLSLLEKYDNKIIKFVRSHDERVRLTWNRLGNESHCWTSFELVTLSWNTRGMTAF